MAHKIGKEFQSYFWLYAPAGTVCLKKPKSATLADIFDKCVLADNSVARLLGQPSCLVPDADRHLTIFEQPRSPGSDNPDDFRYQPIHDTETLVEMVSAMQDVVADYMPLSYGMKRLEILEKTHKIQMAFRLNEDSESRFWGFYDDMTGVLSERFDVCDFYKDTRIPRVIVSKGYKADLQPGVARDKRKMRACIACFNDCNKKIISKPVLFDHLVLGQGLYDLAGQRLASRAVATLYFDGRPFEWHCDDPFDEVENRALIADQAVRPHPAQGREDARQRPSLVA